MPVGHDWKGKMRQPKQTGPKVNSVDVSVHYRLEGLEARSDFWRGLSVWEEAVEEPIKAKGYYEEQNEAENLGWRGFRITKRTIETVDLGGKVGYGFGDENEI